MYAAFQQAVKERKEKEENEETKSEALDDLDGDPVVSNNIFAHFCVVCLNLCGGHTIFTVSQ